MRQNQIPGVRDGPLKREITSTLCRVPRQPEIGKNNRRCVGSIRNVVREEGGGPTEPAKEHLSTWTLGARAPAGEIRARQSVSHRVIVESSALRIESRHPIVGAHPQIAVVISKNASHRV